MIGRQVFSFTAAYLLAGEDRHLEVARLGVEYLLAHAWDDRHGGWYDSLTVDGEVLDDTKTAANELYTNVGLALYAFATGDPRARQRVEASLRIRRTRATDPDLGGYFSQLTRDLTPAPDGGKLKHAHFGYVGSLIHLFQVGRDPEILAWWQELMDLGAEELELKLTAEQYAVVRAPGPVLLSGSAGSGKTTIAVHRLAAAMSAAEGVRALYLTYSTWLRDHARRLFGDLLAC
jgi:hypothetical protein